MDDRTTTQPRVVLSLKRRRITITRKTLQMIGSPEYILLLVKPEERSLVITPGDIMDKRTHRIPPFNSEGKKKPIELCSKLLMHSIADISSSMQYNSSYRIKGELISDENILLFYIDKAELLSK